jgi:mRNA interferase MazF
MVPARGDIIHVSLDPTKGHEQAGLRPAVVLSPDFYNQKAGLLLACPITHQAKGYPFEVEVLTQKTKGVVLSDQIRCLDWRALKVKIVDHMDQSALAEILAKVSVLLSPIG